MFCDYNGVTLKINNTKISGKSSNIWKLTHSYITHELKKSLETEIVGDKLA